MVKTNLKVIDLFSGIGGFSLGLSLAGDFKTVRFCEKDEYCRKVLNKHWPDIPIVEDIHELKSYKGEADLIVGGFPCQPFSQAGKRLAARDSRYLWPEMLRVIKECRPTWVVGENVIGLVSLGLDEVLSGLASAGYSSRVFDIPAVALGAPHRRSRLWIVAHTSSKGLEGFRNGASSSGQEEPMPTSCCEDEDMANTEEFTKREQANSSNAITRRGAPWFEPSCRGWWHVEPSVGRVANGVPRRLDRLRALGNAVVPQIVAEIGLSILSTYK